MELSYGSVEYEKAKFDAIKLAYIWAKGTTNREEGRINPFGNRE